MPTQDVIDYFLYFVDFALIWAMIYGVLYFFRGTRSASVLFCVIAMFLISSLVVSSVKQFVVLRYLLNGWLMPVLGFAILVIFQPEFRRAFAQAGSILSSNRTDRETIDQVVEAVSQLSVTRTGALIVFERNIGLADFVRSSVPLDARVDSLLLQSIFYPNSPLHDCAVVIGKNSRIVAAHVVIPLLNDDEFSSNTKRLGTRHRAAASISQETDASAVVVSEETGMISIARRGHLVRGMKPEELRYQLCLVLLDEKSLWKRLGKVGKVKMKDFAQSMEEGGKDGEA